MCTSARFPIDTLIDQKIIRQAFTSFHFALNNNFLHTINHIRISAQYFPLNWRMEISLLHMMRSATREIKTSSVIYAG